MGNILLQADNFTSKFESVMMHAISTILWPSSTGLDKPVISQSIQTMFPVIEVVFDCFGDGDWFDDDGAWIAASTESELKCF